MTVPIKNIKMDELTRICFINPYLFYLIDLRMFWPLRVIIHSTLSSVDPHTKKAATIYIAPELKSEY